MTGKPVVPRERAHADVEAAIAYYRREAGNRAALGFIGALERAFRHVARHPATGSSRYAHDLGLPGLRSWPLRRYPYLVFYVERDERIDVWRVLHVARDIPGWMRDPDEG